MKKPMMRVEVGDTVRTSLGACYKVTKTLGEGFVGENARRGKGVIIPCSCIVEVTKPPQEKVLKPKSERSKNKK